MCHRGDGRAAALQSSAPPNGTADAKIRKQAALVDKAHDAILVQDLSGRVLYANPSAEKLYGWSLLELERDGCVERIFASHSGRVLEARAAVMAQGDWTGELRRQTRAGATLTVETRWTLIRDEANQPAALLMINSDITDKRGSNRSSSARNGGRPSARSPTAWRTT